MFETIGEGHRIMAEGQRPELDLDELERLAKAATPGPWEPRQGEPVFVRDYDEDEWLVRIFIKKHGGQYLASVFEHMNSYMSWRQCKPFFPGLIAENRALRAKVAEVEREVEEWKESSEEYAIQFHALNDEFIENNPNSFTNRFLRAEEAAKEAGDD